MRELPFCQEGGSEKSQKKWLKEMLCYNMTESDKRRLAQKGKELNDFLLAEAKN